MTFSAQANRPLALLPVQLQARFVDKHLRIRVYPDVIHGDNHDTELTAKEIVAGTAYWTGIRVAEAAGDDVALVTTAERERLAAQVGPYRSLWVAKTTKPDNWAQQTKAEDLDFPDLDPIDAHRPMRARFLPERWVARLYDEDGGFLGEHEAENPVDQNLRIAPSLATVVDDAEKIDSGDHVADFLDRQHLGWTANFGKAMAAGMAFKIPRADLPHRIGAVLVAGIHPGEGVLKTATAFEELLEAHWYRRGVETMPQGTCTNNSDAGGTGFSARAPDIDVLFEADATRRPISSLGRGALIRKLPEVLYQLPAADCQALALGLVGQSVLDRGPQAETLEGLGGWAMNLALGYAMLGRYGSEVLVHADGSSKVNFLADLRSHYAAWVRAGAHIPVLRVGPQPYGLLPIADPPPVYWGWADDFTVKFDHYLSQLIDRFSRRIEAATLDPDATDARPGGTPEATTSAVFDVLGATAHPTNLHTRAMTDHTAEDAATFNDIIAELDAAARNDSVPIGEDAQGNYIFFHTHYWEPRKSHLTGIPSTQVPNAYVYDIAAQWSQVQTLIAEIEAHAPSHIEGPMLDIINNRLVPLMNIHLDGTRSIPDLWAELFDGGGISGGEPPANRTRSFARLIAATFEEEGTPITELVIGESYGFDDLSELLSRAADLLEKPAPPRDRASLVDDAAPLLAHLVNDTYLRVPVDQAAPVRTALLLLRGRITAGVAEDGDTDALDAELSRMMRATLGLTMHRIDAWVTSRAAQALAETRQENPMGLHVGGYGFLLDLIPSDQPQSQGYIHATSMRQAVTAGMLRSGWTGYGTEAATKPLSTDLSSRRTRMARALAQALEGGQDLGEVLGAMFERALHDRDADQWIDDVRLAINPIAGVAHPALQQVAGLLIARSGFANRTRDEAKAGRAFDAVLAGLSAADAANLVAARDEVGAALDSLSDLTMAQAVFALAQGDADTAGAAMSMTGGGDAVVSPLDALDTTRPARLVTHRVGLALDRAATGDPGNLVTLAEPALCAWLTGRLPAAKDVTLRVTIVRGDKRRRSTLSLAALGLDTVTAALLVDDLPSQSDGRIGRLAQASLAASRAQKDVTVTLETHVSRGRFITVDDFALLAAPLVRALREARAMAPADLVAPGAALLPDAVPLDKVMDLRATSMQIPFETFIARVESAGTAEVPALAGQLLAMGVPGALAMGEAPEDRAARDTVIAALTQRLAVLSDVTVPGVERLAQAVGKVLPILTPFMSADHATVGTSLDDSTRIDAVRAEGDRWWRQVTAVRPALVPLATHGALLEAMEDRDAYAIAALQLPHHGMEEWAAVALPDADPGDRMNLVLLDGAARVAGKEVVGLIFDSWTEGIPKPDHQTGIAWHFDTPSARAPQSILLSTTRSDSFDADTVFDQLNHVITLMKMRAVAPDQLRYAPPAHLPQDEGDPDYIEPAIGQYLPGTWLDEIAKLSGADT